MSKPDWTKPNRWQIEDQYAPTYNAWRNNKTPETTSALLRSVEPVLNNAVKQYAPRLGPLAKAKAKQMAIGAFESYDPAKSRLNTHLYSRLQRLKRFSTTESPIISIPEKLRAEQYTISREINKFEDAHGREPSDMELADATGFSLRKLERIRRTPKAIAVGATTDVATGETLDGQKLVDDESEKEWIELIYHELGPIDQYIMERAIGLHGHETVPTSTIAKSLKVSPAAVSQRISKIDKLLKQRESLKAM